MNLWHIGSVVLAYLVGGIPFGLILTHFFGKGDLRKMGSGNIGATNVVRTQGIALGASTFALDFLKGFICCKFLWTSDPAINGALVMAPVIGHMFPVYTKFHGGKGIATYFGVIAALDIGTFYATILTWIAIFMVTKISAVAGLVSSSCSLVFFYYIRNAWCLAYVNDLLVLVWLVLLIFIRHHTNIRQLLKE